jgi:hypothetical protein
MDLIRPHWKRHWKWIRVHILLAILRPHRGDDGCADNNATAKKQPKQLKLKTSEPVEAKQIKPKLLEAAKDLVVMPLSIPTKKSDDPLRRIEQTKVKRKNKEPEQKEETKKENNQDQQGGEDRTQYYKQRLFQRWPSTHQWQQSMTNTQQ